MSARKLVVVGNEGLGDERQDLAAAERRRAVVELAVHAPGHAHEQERIERGCLLGKGVEPALRGIEQGVLPEEVFAGISRDAKLREHDHLCSVGARVLNLTHALLDIEVDIRDADLGRAGADLDEPVLHGSSFCRMDRCYRTAKMARARAQRQDVTLRKLFRV